MNGIHALSCEVVPKLTMRASPASAVVDQWKGVSAVAFVSTGTCEAQHDVAFVGLEVKCRPNVYMALFAA